jgi:hypothetical protein
MSSTWDEKKIKKQKLEKRSVNIESEFIGESTGPKKIKEKKSDLTDEIYKFINEPKSIESIKRILIRLQTRLDEREIETSTIKIYTLPSRCNDIHFFIVIKINHHHGYEYLLSYSDFVSIRSFRNEKCNTSPLKKDLCWHIRNWLQDNIKTIDHTPILHKELT